ncbi:MAG: type II toxin-antitoxin system RelB/DinJ family antitoxin [Coriobacteriales bacterium]|jgi:antitoxin component of RelBE/YafQ-DinJ toxin-antitoxin module
MDPVVTARVPEDVRNRGNEILREIGATPSELINAAYEYVIREKRLPKPESSIGEGKRKLTRDQATKLAGYMDDVHLPVPTEWDKMSFDELFDNAMKDKYASLH